MRNADRGARDCQQERGPHPDENEPVDGSSHRPHLDRQRTTAGRSKLARNESIDSVAMLPALFLAFLQRWHRGEIPYTYQDQGMDPAVAHAMCEAADPVAAFCADKTLWGPLAGDTRLVDAVRSAGVRVQAFVAATPP